MGRWLARLSNEEKSTKTPTDETLKTLKTGSEGVLRVLRVSEGAEINKISDALPTVATVARPDPQFGNAVGALPWHLRPAGWMPEPAPGITILRPAVEVSAVEYDAHLDAMIASLPEDSSERGHLAFAKKKGWCVDREDGRIYTRGRT